MANWVHNDLKVIGDEPLVNEFVKHARGYEVEGEESSYTTLLLSKLSDIGERSGFGASSISSYPDRHHATKELQAVCYSFSTKWADPNAHIKAAAELFPDLRFELHSISAESMFEYHLVICKASGVLEEKRAKLEPRRYAKH